MNAEAAAVSPPAVPDIGAVDEAFGSIKHMPKYQTLPDEFREQTSPYCRAVSEWFGIGVKCEGDALVTRIGRFTPRAGVDASKALRAIAAILRSFEPKHEHKIGGAGYLLSQWFEHVPAEKASP